MDQELTAETILAVFRHRAKRISEIEVALSECRPGAYSYASSMLPHGVDEVLVYAKFETNIRNDRRPNWETERQGSDFDAICDQILSDIAAYKEDMFGSDIERMALAIIQIKHASGSVSDRALRMADFSQEAIEAVHERASLLANEMSDGKPFEVTFDSAHNEPNADETPFENEVPF